MFWWKDCENCNIATELLCIGEKAVPGCVFGSFDEDRGATADYAPVC